LENIGKLSGGHARNHEPTDQWKSDLPRQVHGKILAKLRDTEHIDSKLVRRPQYIRPRRDDVILPGRLGQRSLIYDAQAFSAHEFGRGTPGHDYRYGDRTPHEKPVLH